MHATDVLFCWHPLLGWFCVKFRCPYEKQEMLTNSSPLSSVRRIWFQVLFRIFSDVPSSHSSTDDAVIRSSPGWSSIQLYRSSKLLLRLLGCSPRCSSMNVRKLVIFISGEVWQFFVGSEEIRFKLSSSSINFESFNKLVDSVVLQWLLSNPFEFAILIIVGSTWSSLNQQLMKLFLGDFHFPLSFFFFSTASVILRV